MKGNVKRGKNRQLTFATKGWYYQVFKSRFTLLKSLIVVFLVLSFGVWYTQYPIIYRYIPIKEYTPNIIDIQSKARQYFGNDHQWYVDNVPFLETSDQKLQEVYYYRLGLLKAHIKNIGKQYVFVEYLQPEFWAQEITATIVAPVGHHIYEGRWIKNRRYVDDYITYWFSGLEGASNFNQDQRLYTSWLLDAIYAYYKVNGDKDFPISLYQQQKEFFNNWVDTNYDKNTSMFWILPNFDATEYTVSAIQVDNGPEGGDSYRPTFNSYMISNARALSKFAQLQNLTFDMQTYDNWTQNLTDTLESYLWNNTLSHFMDRFNFQVPELYEEFISHRELAGFAPWAFSIPSDQDKYNVAFENLVDQNIFNGTYGLRTIEISYPQYLQQYREKNECQWNGFSWPFQTTIVLDALANVINNYQKIPIVNIQYYYDTLTQYINQQYWGESNYYDEDSKYAEASYNASTPYIGENYHPDTGRWYSNYQNRSEHYFHSKFIDLVITGVGGLRPQDGDIIEVNPLIASSVKYFALQGISYHGHSVDILWDTVNHFKRGNGLKVYSDSILVAASPTLQRVSGHLNSTLPTAPAPQVENLGVNLFRNSSGPVICSASYSSYLDDCYNATNGQTWSYDWPYNRWSNVGSSNSLDYYFLNFREIQTISSVKIQFFENCKDTMAPKSVQIQQLQNDSWSKVIVIQQAPIQLIGNTFITFNFSSISTNLIRFKLQPKKQGVYIGITEIEVYK